MRSFHRIVLAVLLGLCAANNATAGQNWQSLVKTLQAEYPASGPGAFVIATRQGRILFEQGFGQADLEHHVPIGADSVVRIASLTKQFTAVAVLRLVQDKKLHVTDRLGSVLVNCPAQWKAITIEQLLNQTSGLTDDLSPLYQRLTTDMTVNQLLALYSDLPLVSEPGAKWQYSNLNYWILGKVIEAVSGEPYANFVTRHVLLPGMTRTRYGSRDAIIPGRVLGYEATTAGAWINARYFSPTLGYAAGGFLSTPSDMALWYGALLKGEIIAPNTLALALTETKTGDGKATGYGFGWYISALNGVPVAHHGGSTFGFQSSIYWVPSRAIFIGVFKNSSDERGEPDDDAKLLLNLLMHDASVTRPRQKAGSPH